MKKGCPTGRIVLERSSTRAGAVAEIKANPRTWPAFPDVTVTPRHESLEVTWNVADDGGRDMTEYRVQWKSGSESFDTSRQATATTTEHTIPSLTDGTEYRARGMNEVGLSGWSAEQTGTPVPRPATSLSITTDAQDGVSEPFRVTFTFTDEDHDGTRYGVEGFDVDDIEVRYSGTPDYEFSLKDFHEEVAGFRYSARLEDILERLEDILEGTLNLDSDEVTTNNFDGTIEGVRQTCVECRWQPKKVDWEGNGQVNVRLVR